MFERKQKEVFHFEKKSLSTTTKIQGSKLNKFYLKIEGEIELN